MNKSDIARELAEETGVSYLKAYILLVINHWKYNVVKEKILNQFDY